MLSSSVPETTAAVAPSPATVAERLSGFEFVGRRARAAAAAAAAAAATGSAHDDELGRGARHNDPTKLRETAAVSGVHRELRDTWPGELRVNDYRVPCVGRSTGRSTRRREKQLLLLLGLL